jgi:hypothetical protein
MYLAITPDELRDACRVVYEPEAYKHAPAQIFFDHFVGVPLTTFVRVSFPEKFQYRALSNLEKLRDVLISRHGQANVVFCVYYNLMDRDDLSRHSIEIATR